MVHLVLKSGETVTGRAVWVWQPGEGWFTVRLEDREKVVWFEDLESGHEDGECLLERYRRSIRASVWPT